MFEVLTPMDWRCGDNDEFFKLMDMYFADISNVFSRYGDRYFEMRERVIVATCNDYGKGKEVCRRKLRR